MRFFYTRLLNNSDIKIDDDSNWMLTLNDVLSLLIVFLIIYFMTSNTRDSYNSYAEKEHIPVVFTKDVRLEGEDIINRSSRIKEEISDKLNTEIRRLDLDKEVYVTMSNKEVIISMREKVTFRPGEAEILASSVPILENIAEIAKRYSHFLVEIIGHTDNVPINTTKYPSNWELSVTRATNVLKYFISKYDIDPSRLSIKGNADKQPIAPNDTPENRAQNRRVEIRLKEIGA